MKAYRAMRAGSGLMGAFLLAASLGLAGCSDVDNALFGSGDDTAQASPEPGTLDGSSSGSSQAQNSAPRSQAPAPSSQMQASGDTGTVEAGTLPDQAPPMTQAPAQVGMGTTITPVQIEPGSNTGTARQHHHRHSARARSMATGRSHLAANAQRLADLRNQGADDATAYHEAKARITARLQVGTTRGNPELVAEWNAAQSVARPARRQHQCAEHARHRRRQRFLDARITRSTRSRRPTTSRARSMRIIASSRCSKTRPTRRSSLIDRLLQERLGRRPAPDRLCRQRARQPDDAGQRDQERRTLWRRSRHARSPARRTPPASTQVAYGGTPLVVIRFDQPDVDYQQILYAALSQALQSRPGAGFSVVAVSPTRGTVAAGAAGADLGQEPRAGSDALHDRHGRAGVAARRRLLDRSERDVERSARVRALADTFRQAKGPAAKRGLFV